MRREIPALRAQLINANLRYKRRIVKLSNASKISTCIHDARIETRITVFLFLSFFLFLTYTKVTDGATGVEWQLARRRAFDYAISSSRRIHFHGRAHDGGTVAKTKRSVHLACTLFA